MFELDGKTAMVTGASQGIGRAIALLLASRGARVVVAARNMAKLEALVGEIAEAGGSAHPLAIDLAKPDDVLTQIDSLPEDWADIGLLVNNAGVTRDGLFARMSVEQWKTVIDTNLTGSYAVTRGLIRGMMRQRFGRVVFVSSVVGLMGNTGQANYAASKAGLVGLAKSLAREFGSRNINVNVLAPGFIETAMTDEVGERAKKQLSETIALRRFGTVDDIAAAALFLVSDEASYITGEVLNVSGGMYM